MMIMMNNQVQDEVMDDNKDKWRNSMIQNQTNAAAKEMNENATCR